MKALFIGSDPHLLDNTSQAFARMRSYADVIGSLTILMRHKGESVSRTEGALTVECLSSSKLGGLKVLTAHARMLIKEQGIEVVSCQDPFEHGLIGVRAVRGTKAKLHIQVHTDFLSPWFTRGGIFRSPQISMPVKNALRQKIAAYVLPKAHGIRTVSKRVKESLVTVYGSSIVEPSVLPIVPADTPPMKSPFPSVSFPFTLVTIGRLEPEKRIDDILVALSSLRDAYSSAGLVVIGDGREKERLLALTKELQLENRVVFLGARPDAWALMQSAQAYIQASAYEGYGITLIEAALARVPIITSDVGVIGEVLTGYEDALVSPPGDPTNLAYHIVSLIEDPSSTAVRVRRAEEKAKAHIAMYRNLPEHIARDLASVLTV